MLRVCLILLPMSALACGASTPPTLPGADGGSVSDGGVRDAGPPPRLAPELGTGDRTEGSVTLTEIAVSTHGLRTPRDLAFNPRRPDELWIVNNGDDSVVIVKETSTNARTYERRKDSNANHFMPKPAAIAFGADETSTAPAPMGLGGKPGTFATCGESRNTFGGRAEPNDFMGPALWSSDLSVFARSNANGLGTHLDMLHCSPNCMGIAHQDANVYWAFAGRSRVCGAACVIDGNTASIVKYNFGADNGVGNDDHSDGEAFQYVTGAVRYVEGVPSHLYFDPNDGMLYIADTGNKRIARLDTGSGTLGRRLQPMEAMEQYRMMEEATIEDVVPESSGLLEAPCGIKLRGDFVYVTDNANGRISAFRHDGERVNHLDTGLPSGALAGLTFGPDDRVYFVDMLRHRVLRIDP